MSSSALREPPTYGQPSDVERSHASGFDAHRTQPVDVDALLALLDGLARG